MIIMTSKKKKKNNSIFQPNLFPAWLTIMTKSFKILHLEVVIPLDNEKLNVMFIQRMTKLI